MTTTDTFRFSPATLLRIRRMLGRGCSVDRIVAYLKCDRSLLISICDKHGIDLTPEAEPTAVLAAVEACRRERRRTGSLQFVTAVAMDANSVIGREAARRGVLPAELGACLLEIVARDNLFGAILDK